MKKIFGIFREDLRRVRSSVMACCLMIFLMVIPMLFTWFNILASWDPFGNTNQLKIAVASEDKGYESDLFPMEVNVGEQVLSGLRANDQIDWTITDTEKAMDGTRSGEYYAAIIVPENFSRDMLNFYADGSKPADIALHTNEKKNPLAQTIAGQGAQGVTTNISETFSKTVGDVSLALVSSLSDFMGRDDTQQVFDRLQARTDGLQSQLETGARTARSLSGLVESSIPLVESAQRIIDAPRPELPEVSTDGLQLSSGALDGALESTRQSYQVLGDRIDELYAQADRSRESRNTALNTMADNVDRNIAGYVNLRDQVAASVRPVMPVAGEDLLARLDEAITAQESVRDRLRAAASGGSGDGSGKPDFSALERAGQAIQGVRDSGLRDQVRQLSTTLQSIGQDLDVGDGEITLETAGLQNAARTVDRLAQGLDENAQRIGQLQERVQQASQTGDLSKLADIVGDDPQVLADALAAPVEVDRQPIYPVASFGAGMVPLYTSIALWVGALLSVVALRLDVPKSSAGNLQKYFGRFGIFGFIGLVQATLVTVGLILFVEVQAAYPFLLILAGWVTSVVFQFVVYSFVAAFSNTGKAICVFLLVLQISGPGGSYPPQLLPEWVQNISPFLPATYTVHAMRAAMAGIYQSDYWINLALLAMFILPALFVGIVLRALLANYFTKLRAAMDRTKVMS